MPRSRYCRESPDHANTMIRSCRDRDASDHADTTSRPRRGRDGCDHVDANLRPHGDRDRTDRPDTTRRSNYDRGRSGSSSGSDRAPIPRRRSRTHRGSLAPLRGYCKIVELRKVEEETRIMESKLSEVLSAAGKEKHAMESKLSEVLSAEKDYLKRITDLNNTHGALRMRKRSLSKDITRVKHELAVDQERRASLTEARNYEEEKLEQQLSIALESTATLQDLIVEFAQRSRDVKLFDHRAKRSKSVFCENTIGLDDLSEQPSLSTDDDSMAGSVSATLMPSQLTKRPEGDKDVVVDANGVQEEHSTRNQSDPLEHGGEDPVAEGDAEQQLSPENIIDVKADRHSMPSPCGEPRAFGVGDEFPKESFQ